MLHVLLTFLQDGLFDGLDNLQTIFLDHNEIKTIGLQVFSNRSDLMKLVGIYLHFNRLTSLEPWPMIRAQANRSPDLVVFLSDNQISTFTNELNWTYSCYEKSVNFKFVLAGNKITRFSSFVDVYFTDISQVLCFARGFWNTENFVILAYPFECDCLDFKVFVFFYNLPSSHAFVAHSYCPDGSEVASVPLDAIVCDITA